MRFVLLSCIWYRLVALRNSVQIEPNKCKSSCHEVALEFFITNTPDPPHRTLNWRFDAFCTIWVHLGPFGCLTKLSAKRAEIGQKFVPRSRVRIFLNKCNRSTPLDPKQTFWCLSYYLGAFGTVRLPWETWCKMSGTSAKVHTTKSHRNFSHRTHLIHPLDPKLKILVCFLLFGCIWNRLVALRNSVQNVPN